MLRRLWNVIPAGLRKLLPAIALIAVAIVAGSTDLFSAQVQQFTLAALKERAAAFMPIVLDLVVAGVVLNIAWLLSGYVNKIAEKALERSGASDRGKQLGIKVVQMLFWGIAIFIVLSMFASELMGKFVLGFSVLGAALTLAMQGAANDFICGVLMQFTQRVRDGDEIKVIGLAEVEGKVRDVGYLSTVVESADGVLSVPNRKIWESALKVKKNVPAPSKLILPAGFKRDGECKEKK